jgi:uncharacterized membrane protein
VTPVPPSRFLALPLFGTLLMINAIILVSVGIAIGFFAKDYILQAYYAIKNKF